MEEPTMKYQIVKTWEDGEEAVLATVVTAAFATQLAEEMQDLDPDSWFSVRTVES